MVEGEWAPSPFISDSFVQLCPVERSGNPNMIAGDAPRSSILDYGDGTTVKRQMIITTTSNVPRKKISAYLGMVSGEAKMHANLFRGLRAGLREIVGRRGGVSERELKKAITLAFQRFEAAAVNLGANAVVGADFKYQSFDEKKGMSIVRVSGTAVRFEEGGLLPMGQCDVTYNGFFNDTSAIITDNKPFPMF